MKRLNILFFALLIAAGSLQAQVAAPRLAPVLNNFQPIVNPATLQWDAPSGIGGGMIRTAGEDTDLTDGSKLSDYEEKGNVLQGKLIGETFSASLELMNLETETKYPTNDSYKIELNTSRIGISLQAMDILSVGIGQESNKFTYTFESASSGSVSSDSEVKIFPLVGISLKLAEEYFIGLASGQEVANFSEVELERDLLRYGVGYRTGSEKFQAHLEYFGENRDLVEVSTGTDASISLYGTKRSAILAEVIFSVIYFGGEIGSGESFNDTETANTSDWTTFFVGWAPKEGLAIIGSQEKLMTTDNTDGAPSSEEKDTTTTLSVIYQF